MRDAKTETDLKMDTLRAIAWKIVEKYSTLINSGINFRESKGDVFSKHIVYAYCLEIKDRKLSIEDLSTVGHSWLFTGNPPINALVNTIPRIEQFMKNYEEYIKKFFMGLNSTLDYSEKFFNDEVIIEGACYLCHDYTDLYLVNKKLVCKNCKYKNNDVSINITATSNNDYKIDTSKIDFIVDK